MKGKSVGRGMKLLNTEGGGRWAGRKIILKGLGEKGGRVITKEKSAPTLECYNFLQVLP